MCSEDKVMLLKRQQLWESVLALDALEKEITAAALSPFAKTVAYDLLAASARRFVAA